MRSGLVGTLIILVLFLVCFGTTMMAQDANKMSHVAMATSKFANLPVLPSCTTVSVQRGDPSKESAVLLLKATPGCVIPWHWHTANENLMFVSGKAKLEMKDMAATTASSGDFVYLPGKQPHQFTCISSCTVFDIPDGAFDIHYIDKSGNEIKPEEALKAHAKAPAKKPAPKQ